MNDQKIVDCVQWKHDLYENAYKASGARNFAEYINIVNTAVHHTGRSLPEETVFQREQRKRSVIEKGVRNGG